MAVFKSLDMLKRVWAGPCLATTQNLNPGAHAAPGRFTLEGSGAEAPVEGLANPGEAAAFVFLHPGTNEEIRTLCGDLQVLGRSEFKQLLKWCAPAALGLSPNFACMFGSGGLALPPCDLLASWWHACLGWARHL